MDQATETTAIHEAGHAVALIRLLPGRQSPEISIYPDSEAGTLGRHLAEELYFPGDKPPSEAERSAFEREAIYACAGYAAVKAAGYPEGAALSGCESDFEAAGMCCDSLEHAEQAAISLMSEPHNVRAVSRLARELLDRISISGEMAEFLVDVSDGEATEEDWVQYLVMNRLPLSRETA